MSNLQVEWSDAELLATDDVAEPLVADGVCCHGGYRSDGRYVSPRTRFRVPAIEAWQQSHVEQFGTEILDAPIDLWPEVFPSIAQTKYLLREGVTGPTIAHMTARAAFDRAEDRADRCSPALKDGRAPRVNR